MAECCSSSPALFLLQAGTLSLSISRNNGWRRCVVFPEALGHLLPLLQVEAGLLQGRVGGFHFGGALHQLGMAAALGFFNGQAGLQPGQVRLRTLQGLAQAAHQFALPVQRLAHLFDIRQRGLPAACGWLPVL